MSFQAKDKERRLRLREEKLLDQKGHQEERIRKAIERAQAKPKKKVCLVFFFFFESIEVFLYRQYTISVCNFQNTNLKFGHMNVRERENVLLKWSKKYSHLDYYKW